MSKSVRLKNDYAYLNYYYIGMLQIANCVYILLPAFFSKEEPSR